MGSCIAALVFPAPTPTPELKEELLARPDFLWISLPDGTKLGAVHIQRNSGRTLLYSHGNAEDLTVLLPYLDTMASYCDSDVLAYDYCGYGVSEGTPSEESCYACIDAAYGHLLSVGVEAQSIVAFGRSLGSGPTVDLLQRHPEISAMALQSPLESTNHAALGKAASCCCSSVDLFRNYEKIGDVHCPVLIMHGTDDRVVSIRNGKALHDACSCSAEPLWLEGCGHNDMPYELCLSRLRSFLDTFEQLDRFSAGIRANDSKTAQKTGSKSHKPSATKLGAPGFMARLPRNCFPWASYTS